MWPNVSLESGVGLNRPPLFKKGIFMYEPTRVKIMGQEIEIIYTDELLLKKNAWGLYNHPQQKIHIQTHDHNKKPLKEDFMTAVLWHELCHAMLDILGYSELSANEEFVDRLGLAIKQVNESLD